MPHSSLLAASVAALLTGPALAQDQPATDQPAVEQPAATDTTQAVTTTGATEPAGEAAPAISPAQTLTLAAERLQEVADRIQGAATGTTGATGVAGGVAGTDVAADAAAAASGDGTATDDAAATTGEDDTVTTIVTTDGGSQDVEQEATEALDQFDAAVQGYAASPEGQPAAEQVALIQQQSGQVRQQIEDDPQTAAEGMREMAEAALQLQTAQIPAEADSIVGKQIVSSDGEEAGEVRDLLVTADGQVSALVVERGGALGLGGQQVAVQWPEVRIQGDQITVNMTSDQIDQLPEYQTD